MEQARANRRHAERILADMAQDATARQWVVTIAFYSALHALTDYLLQRGIVVANHTMRERALADPNNGVPAHVHNAYRMLERRSRRVRYFLAVFSEQDVRDLLDQELAAVATFTGM